MATTIARNVKQHKPPAYRLRKGYSQVIVTLTDEPSGRRKGYWLDECGTLIDVMTGEELTIVYADA